MKKRFMKSVISIVLVMVAVFTCSSATVQPRWKYVSSVGGNIDISSLGIVSASGVGTASSLEITKTICTVNLQQMKNSKWVTLKTWSASSNTHAASVDTKHWAVDHGYSYRLYIVLDAYKGNTLLETGTASVLYGYFQ